MVLGSPPPSSLLLAALRTVPLEAQVILELYYWEHLSGTELAAVLGVGEDTARTRLRRARLLVGEALQRLTAPKETLASTLADLDSWARSVRPTAAPV